MEAFSNREEERKYQTEWAMLNLVRELRGISNKGVTPTYYNAIKLATQIIPEVFDDSSLIIQRHHEPELVRSYRQQADAKSQIENRTVEPLELVNARINELQQLLSTDIEYKDLLKKELDKVQTVKSIISPSNIQEDYILHHDVRNFKFGANPINIQAKYSDYKVSENRIIRVRLIHPNDGEQSMGADLIYEQYDQEKRLVRFIVVQYKVWDGKLLYWSQTKNLNPQLEKLEENICKKGYCLCDKGNNHSLTYRYPYCTAFLRPTDKLQYKNSPFTSSGMHIPVCRINDVVVESEEGNKILKKNNMREVSLSNKIFEESFNYNQIGSRWMTYEEAENLYKQHKILDDNQNLIVHVQELEL